LCHFGSTRFIWEKTRPATDTSPEKDEPHWKEAMEFETWDPVYSQILDGFGYGRDGDERARDLLADLYSEMGAGEPGNTVERTLSSLDFEGRTVAIAGGAANLEDDLGVVEDASAVVAASDAASRLRNEGFDVDCMVTDLDGTPETARELTRDGVPVAVHAHGDNIPALETHVPTFAVDAVVPTTQARPTGPVRNFGGFTDGDRAAFLADELGAGELVFPGWRFDDPDVTAEKQRKLAWAARLLRWLEQRRGERFDVLDGRREELDVSTFE
jgi:uncharacterized Rossmann fold enzyme